MKLKKTKFPILHRPVKTRFQALTVADDKSITTPENFKQVNTECNKL